MDLLTRARLDGSIPWEAIADPTRPVTTWQVYPESGSFIRSQLSEFLMGYRRDYQQSQPNHIEIVGEKNTVASIIRPVAGRYAIPVTIGRGYCSLPPRDEMAKRFRRSGKQRLVILMLTDFDPDGEGIAQSFARSMRDDFGIEAITPVKVALTAEQVTEYGLPPVMEAKATSSRSKGFVAKHGKTVHELEALSPDRLQSILRTAIDSVLDIEAFNAELDAEKKDAAFLSGVRRTVHEILTDLDLEGGQ